MVGQQALLGLRARRPGPAEQPALGHLQERRAAAVLGLRPGDHPVGLAGPAPEPPELLVERDRHQADLRVPRPQLRRRRARRPLDPGAPQHGRRALPGDHAPLVQQGHLRQGVPRHARRGRRQVRGLRHGRGGRRREVAGVGGAHLRRQGARHQGPRRRVGEQAHHGRHRQRRPRHPRPLRHRAGPPAGHLPRHAGPGQAGPEPGQDDRVGPVRQAGPVRPAQAAARTVPAQGLHRRSPGREQPPVVHPQDLHPQGDPRGRVRLVGLRVRDRRPRQPVRALQVPGRRLLQDPHGVDRLAQLDHLLELR